MHNHKSLLRLLFANIITCQSDKRIMVNGIGIGTKSGRHGMSIFNVKDTKTLSRYATY